MAKILKLEPPQKNALLITFFVLTTALGVTTGVFAGTSLYWNRQANNSSSLMITIGLLGSGALNPWDHYFCDYYYYVVIDYESNFGAQAHTLKSQIPDFQYFNYKFEHSHEPPTNREDWRNFVTYEDSNINLIATLMTIGLSGQENIADTLLHFVQDHGDYEPCIHYVSESGEYPKYPVETLVEGCGDCEDQAILYASLMKNRGFDVVLLLDEEAGHMMVGISLTSAPTHNYQYPSGWYVNFHGKKYYTAECTYEGWRVGDLPLDLQDDTIYVVEIL